MNYYHLKLLANYNLVRQFSLNSSKQRKNFYDSLEVTPKATQGDIKKAYYKLSKQHHPDTNSGNASAAEKFRDIAEAYEVLGNIKSRRLYDRGIVVRDKPNDNLHSDEPVKEDYKHASFYHHRNKPLSTRSELGGKTRYYNMDEWTSAHYKETFTSSRLKQKTDRNFVDDSIKTKKDIKYIFQIFGAISLILGFGLISGTDASRQFDHTSLDKKVEKPD